MALGALNLLHLIAANVAADADAARSIPSDPHSDPTAPALSRQSSASSTASPRAAAQSPSSLVRSPVTLRRKPPGSPLSGLSLGSGGPSGGGLMVGFDGALAVGNDGGDGGGGAASAWGWGPGHLWAEHAGGASAGDSSAGDSSAGDASAGNASAGGASAGDADEAGGFGPWPGLGEAKGCRHLGLWWAILTGLAEQLVDDRLTVGKRHSLA